MQQQTTRYIYKNSDFEILRYRVDAWDSLPSTVQRYLYDLSESCLWGRDIIYLQHHRLGLALRTLLEAVWEHGVYRTAELEDYLARVWMYSGIYHSYEETKVRPVFSEQYLTEALDALPYDVEAYMAEHGSSRAELIRLVMDPDYEPVRRADGDADTLLERSAVNFYDPSITTTEATAYYAARSDRYSIAPGLNSKLIHAADGSLQEVEAYTDGLYGEALRAIVHHLMMAVGHAPSREAAEVLRQLIAYYESGDIEDYASYSRLWVHQHDQVDMIQGFVETYTDPLGLKGSYEGIVQLEDPIGTARAQKIAEIAAQLEQKSPIAEEYKKVAPVAVSARAIDVVMLAGDAYPAAPLGVNLPNDEGIRATVGSKSVTLSNISRAVAAARNSGLVEEFYLSDEVRERVQRYGALVSELHTDLHEGVGHGSGRLLPGVSGDALREYDATIEEARADLNALYFIADADVLAAGVVPSAEAAYTLYDTYFTGALLVQLARVSDEPVLREAHLQNRALIGRWVLEHDTEGAIALVEQEGKHYVQICDYEAVRGLIGELLTEVQRIKSTGDYAAAQQMVATYGTQVDPHLVAEVKARYATTGATPYIGFVNPQLQQQPSGSISISYEEGYVDQNLRYSREYRTLALPLEQYPKGADARHSEGRWHDLLQSVRLSLKRGMDGEVAKSMRQNGVAYGINFGVNLLQIREIAKGIPQHDELFGIMWRKNVREMKLLALYSLPTTSLTVERALEIAAVSPTIEVSEQLVTVVLMQQPDLAEEVARQIRKNEERYPTAEAQIIPYIVLMRLALEQKLRSRYVAKMLKHSKRYLMDEVTDEIVVHQLLRAWSRVAERCPQYRDDIHSWALKLKRKAETHPHSVAQIVADELLELCHYLDEEI